MRKEKGRCQYCKTVFDSDKYKRTAEHIIPRGIIDLYPEQYITFNDNNKYIDNNGLTIADVCKRCNGTLLSPLDSYGKQLISNNFIEEIPVDLMDNEFPVILEYFQLSRWLLKILFNHQRSKKTDTEWYQRALGYMLYNIRVEDIDFSIFMGMHINTTPLPEKFYTYKPLQIVNNPKLLGNSLCLVSFGIDPFINSLKVQGAFSTYLIRFGTAIFYIILWEKNTDKITKKFYNILMTNEFNFTRIVSNKSNYCLKRVSAHSNTTIGYSHLISASGIKQDDMMIKDYVHGQSLLECQKYMFNSKGKEGMEKTKALIEMDEFPNNTRIKKKYEKYFGN